MRKRIVFLLVCMVLSMQTVILATPVMTQKNEEWILAVTNSIQDYVEKLYSIMDKDTNIVLSYDDFASIDGYIIAKNFEWNRNSYSYHFFSGINNIIIEPIEVKRIIDYQSYYEAMVLVKYEYEFNSNEKNSGNCLYRVTFVDTNGKISCVDIDTNDNDEVMLIKEGLQVEQANRKGTISEKDYVDERFEEWYSSLARSNKFDVEENGIENEETIFGNKIGARGSYSYDHSVASMYGFKCAGSYWYENYIFRRTNPDCTNFISQCVWAGYGGTDGYILPATPSESNATILALKERVANDYLMTSSWYGRNYSSSNSSDPPAKWCGVVEFYDYCISSKTYGPKATGYNDGNPASSLGSTLISQGDVVQFYNNSLGRYRHSAIVTTATSYTVANASNVRIAQHSSDNNNVVLQTKINSSGGNKMRLLKF